MFYVLIIPSKNELLTLKKMNPNNTFLEQSSRYNCSLYIHIPFCVQKCRYCAFYSVKGSRELQQAYLTAIKQELSQYGHQVPFKTIFLGGGSPSAMEESLLVELVRWAGQHAESDAEFTIEVNPGQTSLRLFQQLKVHGANRISIGAQSFDDKELEFLGRIHSSTDIVRCFTDARTAGFDNIGLDLIFALPGSNLQTWEKTLRQAIKLEPRHISAYSLTWEEDTPLTQLLNSGQIEKIDEELDRQQYDLTIDTLESAGLTQYEISNFARPGSECRHNLRYWQNQSYIGLGPAAASSHNGKRTENIANLEKWLQCINDGHFAYETEQVLSLEDIACETAVLNLRTRFGIDPVAFLRQTGYDIQTLFAEPIRQHLNDGSLEWHENRLRLTRQALPIADKILCDFAVI
jgi:oxygen-independent coproporphyrinogen-3 oxidase